LKIYGWKVIDVFIRIMATMYLRQYFWVLLYLLKQMGYNFTPYPRLIQPVCHEWRFVPAVNVHDTWPATDGRHDTRPAIDRRKMTNGGTGSPSGSWNHRRRRWFGFKMRLNVEEWVFFWNWNLNEQFVSRSNAFCGLFMHPMHLRFIRV
jgi:hypothetical protein